MIQELNDFISEKNISLIFNNKNILECDYIDDDISIDSFIDILQLLYEFNYFKNLYNEKADLKFEFEPIEIRGSYDDNNNFKTDVIYDTSNDMDDDKRSEFIIEFLNAYDLKDNINADFIENSIIA